MIPHLGPRVALILLIMNKASSEVIKPLELKSIPDADFSPRNEISGVKTIIQ